MNLLFIFYFRVEGYWFQIIYLLISNLCLYYELTTRRNISPICTSWSLMGRCVGDYTHLSLDAAKNDITFILPGAKLRV